MIKPGARMSASASPREQREFSAEFTFARANVRMWTSALTVIYFFRYLSKLIVSAAQKTTEKEFTQSRRRILKV